MRSPAGSPERQFSFLLEHAHANMRSGDHVDIVANAVARQRARARSGTSKSAVRTAPPREADWRPVLTFACLVIATLAVYSPVWHGGVLWDDDAHLTTEALRSFAGLGRIWTDPGATQQYYPVVNTAFWVMSQLWGSDTLGYHQHPLHATSVLGS
jgi:hypothetical protein